MNLEQILKLAELFYAFAGEAEELPENSDDLKTVLKNIENLETFGARKKYAEKADALERLSSGSSRIVYKTNEGTVLKLASGEKGIDQNRNEANSKVESDYINKVYRKAKNYSWIETRYIENKINEKEFKEMTDIDFDDFGKCIEYKFKKSSDKPKKYDDISKSKVFKEISKVVEKNDLAVGDVIRIVQFGEYEGHPIILDIGLTNETFKKYYEDSKSSSS